MTYDLSTSCTCFSDKMPIFSIQHQKTKNYITSTYWNRNHYQNSWIKQMHVYLTCSMFFGSLHSYPKKKPPARHFRSNTSAFRIKSNIFLIKLWIRIVDLFYCNNIVIYYLLSDNIEGKMCVQLVISFLCISSQLFNIFLHFFFLLRFHFLTFGICDKFTVFQFTSLLLVFFIFTFSFHFSREILKKKIYASQRVHNVNAY